MRVSGYLRHFQTHTITPSWCILPGGAHISPLLCQFDFVTLCAALPFVQFPRHFNSVIIYWQPPCSRALGSAGAAVDHQHIANTTTLITARRTCSIMRLYMFGYPYGESKGTVELPVCKLVGTYAISRPVPSPHHGASCQEGHTYPHCCANSILSRCVRRRPPSSPLAISTV